MSLYYWIMFIIARLAGANPNFLEISHAFGVFVFAPVFYVFKKSVNFRTCYYLLDAHMIFWGVSALDANSNSPTSVVLFLFLTYLFFRRKANFKVVQWTC